MLKVPHGGSTLIGENQQKKKKNLDHLFYVKDFGRLRFNSLKLIIYSHRFILIHIVL
jgi:hypothetical protein